MTFEFMRPHPIKVERPPERQFKCSACQAPKPASDFHRDESKANGRTSACRDCHNARQRGYAAARRAKKKVTK